MMIGCGVAKRILISCRLGYPQQQQHLSGVGWDEKQESILSCFFKKFFPPPPKTHHILHTTKSIQFSFSSDQV